MNEKKKQEIPMDFKLDDFFTSQEQRDDDCHKLIIDPDAAEIVKRISKFFVNSMIEFIFSFVS